MRTLVALALVVVAVSTAEAATCRRDLCRLSWTWTRCYVYRYKYFTCVNGGWSQWAESSHSECSKSCGTGSHTITETRTCTNPHPSGFGAKWCIGESNRTRTADCNTKPCLGDGGWTNWSEWKATTDCSVLCGGGEVTQKRVRTCTNPPPSAIGKPCEGEGKESKTIACNMVDCGDKCVGNKDSVFAAPNPHQYYQCTYGKDGLAKAFLKKCEGETVFSSGKCE